MTWINGYMPNCCVFSKCWVVCVFWVNQWRSLVWKAKIKFNIQQRSTWTSTGDSLQPWVWDSPVRSIHLFACSEWFSDSSAPKSEPQRKPASWNCAWMALITTRPRASARRVLQDLPATPLGQADRRMSIQCKERAALTVYFGNTRLKLRSTFTQYRWHRPSMGLYVIQPTCIGRDNFSVLMMHNWTHSWLQSFYMYLRARMPVQ